jgi:hypothetical protein
MQFPTIPSQKVTTVPRSDVAGVSSATAVGPGNPSTLGAATQPQAPVQPPQVQLPQVQLSPAERRQGSRRDGSDRRRRQVPVLLDTRTGRDRRAERRRPNDPPPGRLDDSA